MLKKILFLICFFILMPVFSFASIYLEKYDFNLEIPDTWQIIQTKDKNAFLSLINNDNFSQTSFFCYEFSTSPDIKKVQRLRLNKQFKGWSVLNERKATTFELENTNSESGEVILLSRLEPKAKEKLVVFEYYLLKGNRIFVISIVTKQNLLNELKSSLKVLLTSYWFGEIIRKEPAHDLTSIAWQMVGQSANNNYSINILPLKKENFNVLWHFSFTGKISLDQRYLVNDDKNIFIANDKTIYALDIDSGKSAWQNEAQEKIKNSPLINKQCLYFISSGSTSYLNVIHSETGALISKLKLDSNDFSHTVLYDNLLYFIVGKKLIALETDSNSIVWESDANFNYKFYPVINNDCIIVVKNYNTLCAIDRFSGNLLWEKKIDGNMIFNPVLANGQVIIFYKNLINKVFDLKSFEVNSGKEIWSLPQIFVLSRILRPAILDNQLFFIGEDSFKKETHIFLVDITKGEKIKEFNLLNPSEYLLENYLLTNQGVFLVNQEKSSLIKIDFKKGLIKKVFSFSQKKPQIVNFIMYLNRVFFYFREHNSSLLVIE